MLKHREHSDIVQIIRRAASNHSLFVIGAAIGSR